MNVPKNRSLSDGELAEIVLALRLLAIRLQEDARNLSYRVSISHPDIAGLEARAARLFILISELERS